MSRQSEDDLNNKSKLVCLTHIYVLQKVRTQTQVNHDCDIEGKQNKSASMDGK